MTTKLGEWLIVIGGLITVWLSIINTDNTFTQNDNYCRMLLYSPIVCLASFGIYAASVVLYRTLTFNDCHEAAAELREEIKEAKADLSRLGFDFR